MKTARRELGEKVLVRAFVEPVKRWEGCHLSRRLNRVAVRKSKCTVFLGDEWWTKGTICGKRVLQEGYSQNIGEEGIVFFREKNVPVYLVAVSLGHMLKVLPEDIRPPNVSVAEALYALWANIQAAFGQL